MSESTAAGMVNGTAVGKSVGVSLSTRSRMATGTVITTLGAGKDAEKKMMYASTTSHQPVGVKELSGKTEINKRENTKQEFQPTSNQPFVNPSTLKYNASYSPISGSSVTKEYLIELTRAF